ncbi:hypothetical protein DBV15_00527 [Temnothorax longispinosus]|uniref:Uncharacterized protein n=1 Tax=Temnothorax longispinosus TaxID=300112 RepID=A0A4S2KT95_9HYME|nr:hypothetical protein DBV15_00527 [Temnothorax longispinosus]
MTPSKRPRLSTGDNTEIHTVARITHDSRENAKIIAGKHLNPTKYSTGSPIAARDRQPAASGTPKRIAAARPPPPPPPPPLTWFSVVGMMSGVCGSIVRRAFLRALASSSNQSGPPARAAGDIIEIGDGGPRKENTLTVVHTVEIDHEPQSDCPLFATVPTSPNSLAALAETRDRYADASRQRARRGGGRGSGVNSFPVVSVEKRWGDGETRNVCSHLESVRGTDGSGQGCQNVCRRNRR